MGEEESRPLRYPERTPNAAREVPILFTLLPFLKAQKEVEFRALYKEIYPSWRIRYGSYHWEREGSISVFSGLAQEERLKETVQIPVTRQIISNTILTPVS